MALSAKGKQVKQIVLDNLEMYVDAQLARTKKLVENEFNAHPTESGGKKIKVGTSQELRKAYDPFIDELLKWKRYKEAIEYLKK